MKLPTAILPAQTHLSPSQLHQTIIKPLIISGDLRSAFRLLTHIPKSSIHPQTISLLLQETLHRCHFRLAKSLHAHIITLGLMPTRYLSVKFLILHSTLGDLVAAHHVFGGIPDPDVIPFNVLISGYVRKGEYCRGLEGYHLLRSLGLRPDQFTFASVLRACACLPTLEHGRMIHGVVVKSLVRPNVVVRSAIVDMYLKCSSMEDGRRAFEEAEERNVVTWTALISGYGLHGRAIDVFELFRRMVTDGFVPNYVTFLVVISACGHVGLVSEGWRYFDMMVSDYGIQPRGEHVAAMVDLLARAGRLNEAYELIKMYPSERSPAMWGALVGACRVQGNIRLLEIASQSLFELAPDNVGKYVVVSNTFAACEMWKDVGSVREMVREMGFRKEPGWSMVELKGEMHRFVAGDKSHVENEKIGEVMKWLSCALVEAASTSISFIVNANKD